MADLDTVTTKLYRAATACTGFGRIGIALEPEPFLGVGKVQFYGGKAAAFFAKTFDQVAPASGDSLSLETVVVSWLAPGEWLVTGAEADVRAALERAIIVAGDWSLATDLTHGRTSFVLSGKDARDTLAAHTPLDVSDRALRIGQVARAPLGGTGMFLARLPDLAGEPCFRVIVDQTMAAYAVRMLAGPASPQGGAA
jgi:sarcosine oxidase subunit gamma